MYLQRVKKIGKVVTNIESERVKNDDNDDNHDNHDDNNDNNEITKNILILNIFLEKIRNISYYFLNLCSLIYKIFGIYLLWICLHYFASHLYVKICVPNTILGFIMSPFMIPTPHCEGLRWIIYNAANMINNMWLITGSWICSTILIFKKQTPNDI